jgi:Ca2+-binding RTX toxin-like protein
VSGNYVVGLPDHKSEIILTDVTGASLSNNVATLYRLDGATGLTETNDRVIANPTDGGAAIQAAWLAAQSSGTVARVSSLAVSTETYVSATVNATTLSGTVLDAAAKTALQTMETERLQGVTLTGTSGADNFKADGQHDTLMQTGAGNDVLSGGGISHNTLVGGSGDDLYNVKSEFDVVVENAGEGEDTVAAYVDYTLTDNVERLKLVGDAHFGAGNSLDNKITGSLGDDEIRGWGGNDLLYGGDGSDRVFGGEGADTANGGAGNDTLSGDAGNDLLRADEGADSLSGGLGTDTMEGGPGADTLAGGAGADLFIFRDGDVSMTPDRIVDFVHADGDRVSLASIDANTQLTGDQKFGFIGTASFHHVAGELRYAAVNGVDTVYGDTNGDGVADFAIVMPGAGTLISTDFIL